MKLHNKRFQVSGFRCRVSGVSPAAGANAAGGRAYMNYNKLKANGRTAEYRISNVEGWNRFAQINEKVLSAED